MVKPPWASQQSLHIRLSSQGHPCARQVRTHRHRRMHGHRHRDTDTDTDACMGTHARARGCSRPRTDRRGDDGAQRRESCGRMRLEQLAPRRRRDADAVHGTLPQVGVAGAGGVQQHRQQLAGAAEGKGGGTAGAAGGTVMREARQQRLHIGCSSRWMHPCWCCAARPAPPLPSCPPGPDTLCAPRRCAPACRQ